MCVILNYPRHVTTFDPPVTEQSVLRAMDASEQELLDDIGTLLCDEPSNKRDAALRALTTRLNLRHRERMLRAAISLAQKES